MTLLAREDFVRERAGTADDVLAKELQAAFERVDVPRRGAVRFARLHRTEAALPCMDVGFYGHLARFQKVQARLRSDGRRLYFAGDYLCGARANGLVASGARAARALVEDERRAH